MNASDVLRDHQKQIDVDGTLVGISRQAIDEVLDELATLKAGVEKQKEDATVWALACNEKQTELTTLKAERFAGFPNVDAMRACMIETSDENQKLKQELQALRDALVPASEGMDTMDSVSAMLCKNPRR